MDSWSTYQNLPPDQVNWADLAQRWMAMRSAQDEHRSSGELNGYGGHFGSDGGPPSHHYDRNGGYDNYGRGDPSGQYHHGLVQNYGRPPDRSHRDYGLHDNFHQDDWSSSTSGPNRPIFPSAAQTKSDIHSDFQGSYRNDWGGAPPPPPCSHDSPEYYRSPGPPSNQYFQHDFPHGPSPSGRNWGSPHPSGSAIRVGPPVGGPPLPNGPHHGLPPAGGPTVRSSSPSGPPPPTGNPSGGVWYPTPFYPPPFAPGVSNSVSSQHQSGSGQSPAPPFFSMDASARKKLPAWILEGLEKAEREKMKQLEKEERMKRAEEERAKRRVLAGKGRFDSSSEDEDEEHADDEQSNTKSRQSCVADGDDVEPVFLARRANLPVEDLRTEEEKKDDAMASVKFIMMALLLESTDEALRTCISESIREMKHEAEPKLLAKSSALAALSSLGGGDESDDENDGEEKREDASKSRNGDASPSSESGDENTVFKTPLGVPRKTSKQTTTSAEDPSKEAVSAGDGMDSVKANLRRSAKNDSEKSGNTGKSSDDTDAKRRRRSRSRERRRCRSGDRRRRSRERRRSSSRNRSKRSRSREHRRSRSPVRNDRRRSRSRRRSTSRDRRRSRERRRSRSSDRKRYGRERSAEGRRDRSTSRERRRR